MPFEDETAKALRMGRLPFNPEGELYDYYTAQGRRFQRDEEGHLPSRDPQTGLLLKGMNHRTVKEMLKGEEEAGFEIRRGLDERYRSFPKERSWRDKLISFATGEDETLASEELTKAMLDELGPIEAYERLGGIDPLAYGAGQLRLLRGGSGKLAKAGEFDFSKIGSERGAAFGWGAYFTDAPSIAKSYAKGAAKKATAPGGPLPELRLGKSLSKHKFIPWTGSVAVKWKHGGKTAALDEIRDNMEYMRAKLRGSIEGGVKRNSPLFKGRQARLKALEDLFQSVYSGETTLKLPKPSYKAGITQWDIHKGKSPGDYDFLDWSKEVPPRILNKIRSQARKEGRDIHYLDDLAPEARYTGSEIYQGLKKKRRGGSREVSLFLNRAGITGLM